MAMAATVEVHFAIGSAALVALLRFAVALYEWDDVRVMFLLLGLEG